MQLREEKETQRMGKMQDLLSDHKNMNGNHPRIRKKRRGYSTSEPKGGEKQRDGVRQGKKV